MGIPAVVLCAAVFVNTCLEPSLAAGRCPPPEKIYDYSKKESCRSDSDCKNGKICCLNPARVKSCAYSDPYSSGLGGGSASTNSVYCEGVKCQPFQVCKPDPNNKRRMTCQRA